MDEDGRRRGGGRWEMETNEQESRRQPKTENLGNFLGGIMVEAWRRDRDGFKERKQGE